MISNEHVGQWFLDRTPEDLAEVSLWTAPVFVYKVVLLFFALWLAASLVHWVRWGWAAYRGTGRYRRRVPGSARGTRAATEHVTSTPGGNADAHRARIS